MEISKCKTCEHYDVFFGSCKLYAQEVYLGEGEFAIRPISIREIEKEECEYVPKKAGNNGSNN